MSEQIVEGKRASGVAATFVVLFVAALIIAVPMLCWNFFGRDMVVEIGIRKAIDTQLSAIKSGDVSAIVDAVGTNDDALSSLGIDETEFYQTLLEGFDYKIDDVSVKGDTGKATIEVTVKDVKSIGTPIGEALSASIADGSLLSGDKTVSQVVGDAVIQGIQDTDTYTTTTVTLDLARVDGKWQATNLQEALSMIALGDESGTELSNDIQSIESNLEKFQEQAQDAQNVLSALQDLQQMFGGTGQ